MGSGRTVSQQKSDRDRTSLKSYGVGSQETRGSDEFSRSSSEEQSAFEIRDTVPKTQPSSKNGAPTIDSVGAGLKRPSKRDDQGNPALRKRARLNSRKSFAEDSRPDEGELTPLTTFSGPASNNAMAPDEKSGGKSGTKDSDLKALLTGGAELQGRVVVSNFRRQLALLEGDEEGRRSDRFKVHIGSGVEQAVKREEVPEFHSQVASAAVSPPVPVGLPSFSSEPTSHITGSFRKVFNVSVSRPSKIQALRLALPILADEQKIMEAIQNNPVVVLWGATGSGKSTQVPQFLYEAGYANSRSSTPGMIGITQPRRVAAVSTANRVSVEMGDASSEVSYQIRFDSTVGKHTAIKYMTDGILLREIVQDFALSRYSAIIIDEAHERSTNTDILVGMLSRIVELRQTLAHDGYAMRPLKLIIMSATLQMANLTANTNLFRTGTPPLIRIEGRQYPVRTHFSRRTQRDYCEEMFHKICKGHKKLPSGGMLVFLTGESEIISLIDKLRQKFPTNQRSCHGNKLPPMVTGSAPLEAEDLPSESENATIGSLTDQEKEDESDHEPSTDEEFVREGEAAAPSTIYPLPLYSKLPTEKQLRIFEPVPSNCRLIVVATNVAETSLTIPGIRYVFDSGRAKEKRYNHNTGVQSFEIDWISKASADQRAGRAGRTGPGHCYRLYSSAVYERDFKDDTEPELLRTPIDGVVLQLKSMNISDTTRFPFPVPLDLGKVAKAEKLLHYLGAVDGDGQFTDIGAAISAYPLAPRLARILTMGVQHDCLCLAVAMVAALAHPDLIALYDQRDPSRSAEDPSLSDDNTAEELAAEQKMKWKSMRRALLVRFDSSSDAVKLLSVFIACYYSQTKRELESFCRDYLIHPKAIREALQLWEQLIRVAGASTTAISDHSRDPFAKVHHSQITALKQMIAVSFLDQIAIRADLSPHPPEMARRPQKAIDVPFFPLFTANENKAEVMEDRAVYIHPSSLLAHHHPTELPQYIVYSHLQRAMPDAINTVKRQKTRMHPLTPVSSKFLTGMADKHPLFQYSKPIGSIEPVLGNPDERMCWVIPSMTSGTGQMAWPLQAQKILEKKNAKGTWERVKILGDE